MSNAVEEKTKSVAITQASPIRLVRIMRRRRPSWACILVLYRFELRAHKMWLSKATLQENKKYLAQFQEPFRRYDYVKHINSSSDAELRVLIKLIHSVVSGSILCPKENYRELKRKKLLPFLNRHFRTKEDTRKILKEHRKEQLYHILKILSGLHDILAALFVKRP